jgi:hypothetical protein
VVFVCAATIPVNCFLFDSIGELLCSLDASFLRYRACSGGYTNARYRHAINKSLLAELEATKASRRGLTFKILRAAVLTQSPLEKYFDRPFSVFETNV